MCNCTLEFKKMTKFIETRHKCYRSVSSKAVVNLPGGRNKEIAEFGLSKGKTIPQKGEILVCLYNFSYSKSYSVKGPIIFRFDILNCIISITDYCNNKT